MVPDPGPIIQATLAPVFLVSGAGIFLNFLQSRLFRINDRIRAIQAGADDTHKAVLKQRARLLRDAILMQVLVIAFIVVTALLLMAGVAFPGHDALTYAVLAAFSLALLCFAASLGFTVKDTFLSVRFVERDTR
ncbi:MAG TPA: DUF2721 domain-containing protein [Candidatus Thermoplasmatota archaeon]|nr:DUF2721 domain-containing protein [Candidatus Thermoplasmatota archaeon]